MSMIQTFPTGSGSGGGHTILDTTGTTVNQEPNLQFKGLSVTDNSTDEVTEVAGEGLNQDSIDDVTSAVITNPSIIVGDGALYSTTERIVGKWIDGKPVYQKTISQLVSTYTDSGGIRTFKIEPVLTGVDTMVDAWGSFKSNFDWGMVIPSIDGNTSSYVNHVGNNISVYVKNATASADRSMSINLTIQYTKTTD